METFLCMPILTRLYQYVSILSFDVVAGAVIGAVFFARVLEKPVSPDVLVALALTVWIVYTTDHLRDAYLMRGLASTDRHRFHQKHFRVMSLALITVFIVDLIVVAQMEKQVVLWGMVLGVVVGLYLLVQRHLAFTKEFFVASLYTCGILLPSLSAGTADLALMHYVMIGKYFVTACMNLLLFSLIDYEEDQKQDQKSFVTWFGPRFTQYGIVVLGGVNIASGVWVSGYELKLGVVFISMNTLLLLILLFRKSLSENNYFRMAGDGVFFIPLCYLI